MEDPMETNYERNKRHSNGMYGISDSIVFDIETVPDAVSEKLKENLFSKIRPTATAIKKGEEAVLAYIAEEKREIEEKFALSPMTGRVHTICAKIINGHSIESITIQDESDERVISEFIKLPLRSTLITFNGKSFDVPFLKIRAAKYGFKFPRLSTKKYDIENHFDCYEVLSNFGTNKNGTLKQWAMFFDIPISSLDGKDIGELTNEEIAKKCLSDVAATHEIYQRICNYY